MILEGFGEGFGIPKSMFFAYFSMIFRCQNRSAFWNAKKLIKNSKKANFSAFWRRVCGAGGALGREKKREGYEFWPKNFEEEFRDHTEDAELKSSTPLPTKVGRRIEGPQGGTPPLPHSWPGLQGRLSIGCDQNFGCFRCPNRSEEMY